jgi:hypothetical protein
MPGLILKARGHDIRKGHLGWTLCIQAPSGMRSRSLSSVIG